MTNQNLGTLESHNTAASLIEMKQRDRLLEQKEALVESESLREVIGDIAKLRKGLGDPNLLDSDTDILTAYESDFAGVRNAMRSAFDFRTKPDGSYGERWEAEERAKTYLTPALTPELEAKIYAVAEQFGLTGDTEPQGTEAAAGIILGAGGKAPLDRTLYLKELIDQGKLKTDKIVSLGSERPVNDAERARAGEYATNAETEFDLMVAAIETAYDIKISADDMTEWIDQTIEHDVPRTHKVAAIPANDMRPDIFIVSSAVTTDPYVDGTKNGRPIKMLRNRANTKDTFDTLSKLAQFEPGSKVVATTNAHFVPFQGAVAAGELGKMGIDTEVVGFDPIHFNNAPKKSHELLQEMLTVADSIANASEE
jgi:hypothetical protein